MEENLEDISFGLYQPHFSFEHPEDYKARLNEINQKKKEMIRSGTAAVCFTNWTVEGSLGEGRRMTKRLIKIVLRAFNGECDAAIAKTSWNNVARMEERIRKSFEAINTLGAVNKIEITNKYLALSLDELRISYEYEAKKREIHEEQRAIREQQRDEDRALWEAERAQEEAEAEELRYQKALEKARAELAQSHGAALNELNLRIQEINKAIQRAREKKDRAISMAQLTRSGYVYIISNEGAFGQNVFKIGMTRRLEPQERIDELGGASVPFPFDIHAMIYSEDAPGLEAALHERFAASQVNLVNPRKEFFAISLDQIEIFARERKLKIKLSKLAEARQYRETLALRNQLECLEKKNEQFPRSLEQPSNLRAA